MLYLSMPSQPRLEETKHTAKAYSILRARPIVASILSKIGRTERPPRDGIQLYHFNGTICLQKSIKSNTWEI